MICKNCQTSISEASKFCDSCGAKVITERLSVKNLWSDVTQNVFGWDNKFFLTIRKLITAPQEILGDYLDGIRKKYTNPITFFAIGMAISIFIFNTFDEEYLKISLDAAKVQNEWMAENIGGQYKSVELQKESLELNEKIQKGFLKFFNIISLLLLPLYAFIAFLVYRKPYNYAEHLTVTTYIQGFSFFLSSIFFLVAINTSPFLYSISLLCLMFFYCYAYGKLYKLSIGQSIIKFIFFLAILFVVIIALGIMGFAIGIGYAYFSSK
ncbi:DUF3667 domain-containing protein [Maribacter sp. HTCC2170]|uniref:DUF3667 domain-containing protein n=1 Tax=Maribacter sp. (strain HTCC2170 / KCCM 42371) TaxID=313603 RepID=UPI00006B3AE4|nr:DUF3667 domain-containing protein [Maribacter sp. HTCC2170]EAQ99773.1 hypothetical protein FB2170_07454 [Maribacter sp. HTCC2170]